ncbi:hypothetical protein O9K51_01519 [Purpureocillium lavendulum]|uniref:Uncharacterized protein n=1 Tax=Purpureocillium lavendulum TaxID=1247861 RepID=A0AB34G735_9HYPO|nr:hypothetical protein O9K51_01519 [Purpureocillium lavendulum]
MVEAGNVRYPPCESEKDWDVRWYWEVKTLWDRIGSELAASDRDERTGSWIAFVFLRTRFGYTRLKKLTLAAKVAQANPEMNLETDMWPAARSMAKEAEAGSPDPQERGQMSSGVSRSMRPRPSISYKEGLVYQEMGLDDDVAAEESTETTAAPRADTPEESTEQPSTSRDTSTSLSEIDAEQTESSSASAVAETTAADVDWKVELAKLEARQWQLDKRLDDVVNETKRQTDKLTSEITKNADRVIQEFTRQTAQILNATTRSAEAVLDQTPLQMDQLLCEMTRQNRDVLDSQQRHTEDVLGEQKKLWELMQKQFDVYLDAIQRK